jgi:antitoxin PrlF
MESIMAIALEEISTITAKGQTTIPKAVRQALGVGYGGRIAFRVSDGGVTVCRADSDEDPAVESFLSFLAADLKQHPEAVKGAFARSRRPHCRADRKYSGRSR